VLQRGRGYFGWLGTMHQIIGDVVGGSRKRGDR
jgi:hypothetical protein